MEKDLLNSISNFASALDSLVDQLEKQTEAESKSKSTYQGIFGKRGVGVRLKKIEEGIKKIKEDTQTIIKNQKELLSLSKVRQREENVGLFDKAGDKKSIDKIKNGVGVIALIAGAVIAIGMAFKIISPVDVMTVLAVSFAITLMAHTISKIMESGVPSQKDSLMIGLSILAFTGGVVASSWLMTLMAPVSGIQLLTFGAILGAFALSSYFMGSILDDVGEMNFKSLAFLPLVLTGISLAIMASSFILQYVQPVDPSLLLNIVLMGATLGVLAIAMSIPLYVISQFGSNMLKGALLGIIILPAISLAVMLSSYLISMGDYSQPLPIGWVLSFSLGMLILTLPVAILGAIPFPMILMGSLALVVISAAIVASSYILSMISKDFLMGIADSIAYFVDVVGSSIIRFASNILPILIKMAGQFFREVMPPFVSFLEGILPPLSKFLTTLLEDLFPYIQEIMSYAKVIVTEIDDIIIAISKVLDSVGNIIEKIGGVFSIIGDKIIGILSGVSNVISTVADSIVSVFNGVTNSIATLSKLDGRNLAEVGAGLAVIGGGLLAMTGGSIISGIASLFGGGIDDKLESISKFHNEIYKTGIGVEKLAMGLEMLNDIDMDDDQVSKVLNVLERVNNLKPSASLETISTQVIDGANFLEELKGVTDSGNEELINEIRLMNQSLDAIRNNSGDISSQLRRLRDESGEPSLDI